MNKENAHEYLPLVQALANGKTIQHPSAVSSWKDYPDDTDLTFELDARFYRVKPEPRTFELYRNKKTGVMLDANGIELINFPEYERITVQEVLK
jgi:hypothetical protein